jgi:hypothetical protein
MAGVGDTTMPMQYYFMPCTIKPGGFTSERTFEIKNGRGRHLVGVASVEYLLDDDRKPLTDDVPCYGQEISGYVKCLLIKVDEERGVALVELPSDEVIPVCEATLVSAK